MAVTIEVFKRPRGRLNPTWFDESLDDLLTAYLSEAVDLTDDEKAQVAWVYHRAFQALADDRALLPATLAADDVRESYTADQLAIWRSWASDYLSEYQLLTRRGSGGPVITPIGFR